jgi:hypothetical protein
VRSCLIDGEVVCCDEQGHRRNEPQAFLYAFDLLGLKGRTFGGSRLRDARPHWPASCGRAARACAIDPDARRIGSSSRTRRGWLSGARQKRIGGGDARNAALPT